MKQLETLGFEADELPARLVEVTADQLTRDAESTALKSLANYITPFGVKLAAEVESKDEHGNPAPTNWTQVSTRTVTGKPGHWDSTSATDRD